MFTPLLPKLKDNVHIILGTQLDSQLESQLRGELAGPLKANCKAFQDTVRKISKDYSVTIIDMNPSFSALNEVLLGLADDVLELVTGDVFSQASMQNLVKFRLDKNLNFNVGVVPSMIRRSRQTLKPAHRKNVEKIFTWVKQKRINNEDYIRYLGFIGLCDSIYGKKPLEWLKRPSSREHDLMQLREDVARVFMHILEGDQEPMQPLDSQFVWEEQLRLSDAGLPEDKGFIKLYIFRKKTNQPGARAFKIGTSKNVETRSRQIKFEYKTNWEFVKAFRCEKGVGLDVEKKIKTYYITEKDQGEMITENAIEFEKIIPYLSDRQFIEDLLLEA